MHSRSPTDREDDSDTRTTSLRRCLLKLIDLAPGLTVDVYVRGYLEQAARDGFHAEEELANGLFAALSAPGGGLHGPTIQSDLQHLGEQSERASAYVNEVIAHRDFNRHQEAPDLTFEEIDTALINIGELMQKYHPLGCPGVHLGHITPIPDLTFLRALQRPWLPPGAKPPQVPSI